MNPQAQRVLREIRSLQRFDNYLRCARAELASDPANAQLGAFISMIERLVEDDKARFGVIAGHGAGGTTGQPLQRQSA